jgi:hypothetical protein
LIKGVLVNRALIHYCDLLIHPTGAAGHGKREPTLGKPLHEASQGHADVKTNCRRNTPVELPPVKTHQAVTVLMNMRLQKALFNMLEDESLPPPATSVDGQLNRSDRSTHVMIIEGRVTVIRRIALWMEEAC